jgi:hypothetical protein
MKTTKEPSVFIAEGSRKLPIVYRDLFLGEAFLLFFDSQHMIDIPSHGSKKLIG